jgi:hypothetical protein
MQGNPNKSKENSLLFLGFPWAIRAFSTGYGEIQIKKIPARRHSRFGLYTECRSGGPVHSLFTTDDWAARPTGQKKER